MSNNVLVFSIALNGYQWLYKSCLASHKRYALRYGYRYAVVTHPSITSAGVECCWLKLTLLRSALNAGYDSVMFIDADACVKFQAPAISSVLEKDKYLYLVKGYSGRFNSGVLLIKNHVKAREWIEQVLSRRHLTVEAKNDVCWGENGHIIQQTKDCLFVCTLDRRWNNTSDPNLEDYIRHYNHGPLRRSYTLNIIHKILSRITRVITKSTRCFENALSQPKKDDKLTVLTASVLSHYSCFHHL
jgi:hypothetical protein